LEKIEGLAAGAGLAVESGSLRGEERADLRAGLLRYMEGIRKCVQTCWLWQVDTKRYKRPQSIWKETSLSSPVAV